MALQCNRKKDGAKNAQESDIMLYLTQYLSHLEHTHGTQTEKAVVIGVNKQRFDIYVPKYGLEYCVQLGALPLQAHVFDKGRLDLVWKAGVQANAGYFDAARDRKCDDDDDDDDDDNDEEDDNDEKNDDDPDEKQGAMEEDQLTTKLADITVDPTPLPRKLHCATLDSDKCKQSIDLLATIDVHVIPDKSQTPPRIHIFPINPF
jgi:protein SSD1